MEGPNTSMALTKFQLHWLDKAADFVRVLSFYFSKAFDSVSHLVLCDKLKSYDINPYIINWVISFLRDCQQRVVLDGVVTKFLNINRGVPQGTDLGLILFSIMVNEAHYWFNMLMTSLLVYLLSEAQVRLTHHIKKFAASNSGQMTTRWH